mmetsp:Transcript_61336/g.145014  ORF Transcript_61336/g.145014 Transcript_61336/m.145014 type:complete len:316 (-) Transcript_61336:2214-3161(-)
MACWDMTTAAAWASSACRNCMRCWHPWAARSMTRRAGLPCPGSMPAEPRPIRPRLSAAQVEFVEVLVDQPGDRALPGQPVQALIQGGHQGFGTRQGFRHAEMQAGLRGVGQGQHAQRAVGDLRAELLVLQIGAGDLLARADHDIAAAQVQLCDQLFKPPGGAAVDAVRGKAEGLEAVPTHAADLQVQQLLPRRHHQALRMVAPRVDIDAMQVVEGLGQQQPTGLGLAAHDIEHQRVAAPLGVEQATRPGQQVDLERPLLVRGNQFQQVHRDAGGDFGARARRRRAVAKRRHARTVGTHRQPLRVRKGGRGEQDQA